MWMYSDHELQLCVGRWMKAARGYSMKEKQAGMWGGGGDADGKNNSVKHQWRFGGKKADNKPVTHKWISM